MARLLLVLWPLAAVAVVELLGFGLQQAVACAVGLDSAPFDAPFAGAGLVLLALFGLADVVQVDDFSHDLRLLLAKKSPGAGGFCLRGILSRSDNDRKRLRTLISAPEPRNEPARLPQKGQRRNEKSAVDRGRPDRPPRGGGAGGAILRRSQRLPGRDRSEGEGGGRPRPRQWRLHLAVHPADARRGDPWPP